MVQPLRPIPGTITGSVEDKRKIAEDFGLPGDFYENYSDEDWDNILQPWLNFRSEMSREIEKYKKWEDAGILDGITVGRDLGNVPMSRWMRRFLIYRAFRQRPILPFVKTAIA
jgi:hypothetical protein